MIHYLNESIKNKYLNTKEGIELLNIYENILKQFKHRVDMLIALDDSYFYIHDEENDTYEYTIKILNCIRNLADDLNDDLKLEIESAIMIRENQPEEKYYI